MQVVQRQMALWFIARLNRDVDVREKVEHNGFELLRAGSNGKVGFVRYNLRDGIHSDGIHSRHRFSIYPYTSDFHDPRGLFSNNTQGNPPIGWLAIVDPDDRREMRYVLRIMRQNIDG